MTEDGSIKKNAIFWIPLLDWLFPSIHITMIMDQICFLGAFVPAVVGFRMKFQCIYLLQTLRGCPSTPSAATKDL